MVYARVRRQWIAGLTVSVAALAVAVAAPSVASASPFVEGESLEWCGGGGLTLSGDGQTAISGECVFVRSGGAWVKQGVLPLPEFVPDTVDHEVHYGISSDGKTVVASGEFTSPGDPVFVRNGVSWTESAVLPGGIDPLISGDGDTASIPGYEDGHGFVEIFVRSGETWSLQATLSRSAVQKGKKGAAEAENFYPDSLDGDGNTILTNDWAANKGKGADYVYVRSGETWTQQAEIAPSGIKGKQTFGLGVLSADGSTALIPETSERSKGAVWFFTRSGETWKQQGPKIAPKVKSHTFFGRDTEISGDGSTALVLSGNPENEPKGVPKQIWVYERSGESWANTELLLPPSDDACNFAREGMGLSEDGSTVITDCRAGGVTHTTLTWSR